MALDVSATSYRQTALVRLHEGGDARVLGGAVTLALCGSWDHTGPCPLAEHETTSTRRGELVTVEVVFRVGPENLAKVRGLITTALTAEQLRGPDGMLTSWELISCQPGD